MYNPFLLKFEIHFTTLRRGRCCVRHFTRETSNLRKYEKYFVRRLCLKILNHCTDHLTLGGLTLEHVDCSFELCGIIYPLGDDLVNGTVGDLVHVFRDAEPRKNEMVVRIDYLYAYRYN